MDTKYSHEGMAQPATPKDALTALFDELRNRTAYHAYRLRSATQEYARGIEAVNVRIASLESLLARMTRHTESLALLVHVLGDRLAA